MPRGTPTPTPIFVALLLLLLFGDVVGEVTEDGCEVEGLGVCVVDGCVDVEVEGKVKVEDGRVKATVLETRWPFASI